MFNYYVDRFGISPNLGSQSLVLAQIWKDCQVLSLSLRMLVLSQYVEGFEAGRMVATGITPVVRCYRPRHKRMLGVSSAWVLAPRRQDVPA